MMLPMSGVVVTAALWSGNFVRGVNFVGTKQREALSNYGGRVFLLPESSYVSVRKGLFGM
jgi:hypothetical protein